MVCNSKPKWLELRDGEVYLKSVMSRQALFVFMMAALGLLSLVMLVALIAGDAGEIMMPMTMVIGSMTSVMAIGITKLHITNQRLVFETKHKNAGEIRLDEIKAIQVTKRMFGGKVLIVPARKGAGGIEVNVIKPEQLAGEIQELSAAIGDDAEAN